MELVRENVDVIVVDGTAAAKACKGATATIPIVFALAVDPVADGLAASFARPAHVLCVPKIRFCNIGDEGRRGQAVK
jgi:ABC-type uncharacterized transport system substrate-binding protein